MAYKKYILKISNHKCLQNIMKYATNIRYLAIGYELILWSISLLGSYTCGTGAKFTTV